MITNTNEFRVTTKCYLCNSKNLQVMEDNNKTLMQCLACGYSTSTDFEGTMENEKIKALDEDMKSWSKEAGGFVWLPSVFNLKNGMIYPKKVDGNLKWAFSMLVDIPEEDKEKYKKEDGSYYTKKYNMEDESVFDSFLEVISSLTIEDNENDADSSEENRT